MTPPVFLSASEPYNTRNRAYWDSRNLLLVREAVRALVAYVLPRGPLVFGGHPTITPLVRGIADRFAALGTPTQQCLIFQSKLYFGDPPPGGPDPALPQLVLTEAHGPGGEVTAAGKGSRNVSLLRMRYEMLGTPGATDVHPLLGSFASVLGEERNKRLGTTRFSAAFFIGGMEGVEREYRIFRTFHPDTPAFPLASTGSAAKDVFQKLSWSGTDDLKEKLEAEVSYSLLFEQLLAPRKKGIALMGRPAWKKLSPSYPSGEHIDPPELEKLVP